MTVKQKTITALEEVRRRGATWLLGHLNADGWYITSGKAERLLGYEARYTVYDMVEDAIRTRETPV